MILPRPRAYLEAKRGSSEIVGGLGGLKMMVGTHA